MTIRFAFLLAAACVGAAGPTSAQARGFLGGEFLFLPWPYPVWVVPQPRRPALPEQPAPVPQTFGALPSREPTYWYCLDAGGYYPDVTDCAGGWQQVVPRRVPPPPTIESTPQGGTRLRSDNSLDTR
jgi:hypothetical protein